MYSQKNAPTLASCSFKKLKLIVLVFGKQRQHAFRNDTRIQLSLSLHLYLPYLVLNSHDGNDAFSRHSMRVKQFSSFSRKHRTLSLETCVRQTVRLTRKPSRLQNLATDGEMYVHCTRHNVSATPATWCSASMTHGQAYHKPSNKLVSGESGCVHREGKRTSLWTSAKVKPDLFRANTLHNRLFSEPLTVYRGKHVVTRLFHRSYLKVNKISKSEGIR